MENFKYLVFINNEGNKRQIDLQDRIKAVHKTYLMLQKFFRNKSTSRKVKLILKYIIIHKSLT